MKRLRKLSESSTLLVGEITANLNYIYRALEDISTNNLSFSVGQPLEIWKSNDNKNVLINGYHRFVEGILDGKDQFNVTFVQYNEENKEYIDEYNPSIYDTLSKSSKYKGLEEFKSEKELDELAEILKEEE